MSMTKVVLLKWIDDDDDHGDDNSYGDNHDVYGDSDDANIIWY